MRTAPARPATVSAGASARAVTFVVLAYLLAWLACLPLWLAGRGLTQPLTTICALLMMLTPTVSAVTVHLLMGRGRRLDDVVGLRLGPWRRWLPYALLAWLGPIVLSLLALSLAAAVGVYRTDLTAFSGLPRSWPPQPPPVRCRCRSVSWWPSASCRS